MSSLQQHLNILKEEVIIPVVRLNSYEDANLVISELQSIGYKTVEITLTIPNALKLISQWANSESLLVGAGTVTSLKEARECIEAGAKYIVSPCYVDGLGDLCAKHEVLCIMSGITPSEILKSFNESNGIVKVFPASSVGGSSHIKSIKAIFPHITLLPTGGINLNNIEDYLNAGANLIGAGSDLIDLNLIQNHDLDRFRYKAKKYKEIISQFRKEGN